MKKILLIVAVLMCVCVDASAVKMSDLKIYINPGHGGYESDDRNIEIYPYEYGDSLGYWESKSNLYKGLFMYHMLDSLGATPYLSRIKNNPDDDRDLYDIAEEANSLECDLFFSIHSNAGETVNYPLMLYREDAVGVPRYPEAKTLSDIVWEQLHSNELPIWTRDEPYVSGDLTFYPQWGTSGLGVLRRLYVVGLLSEGSMHEHRPEAHRLMNMDYCWLEAWHFVKSIMEYYDTEDKFVTGNVAGVVYDDHNTRENTLDINRYTTHGRDVNMPLNGATVELRNSAGNVVQKRTTDNDNNGVFVFRNVTPGEYKVVVSKDGYYVKEADVTVIANEVTYNDMPMSLKREMPLEIVSYSPVPAEGELVSCVEPIVFNFNTDVDETSFEQAVTITPAVEGSWEYSNSYKTATFKPKISYELTTHYTVVVSTDAKTADPYYENPNLQKEFKLEFDTQGRNRLELILSYPSEGDKVHYETPSLEFRFDKTLNAQNIYDRISITDEAGNSVGINRRASSSNKLSNGYGNVTLQLSSDLEIGKSYKVVLSGEIVDSEGIPLTDDVVINFEADDQSVSHTGDILEEFEDASLFTGDESTSISVERVPSYYRYTSRKLFGSASGQFSYSFADSEGGEAVWKYNGCYHTVLTGAKIGLYVFGDLNNHELYAEFTSGTDVKYIKICDVNFLGWKYCEASLDELLEDFEYLFTGIKVAQRSALYAQSGALYLDNLIYDASGLGVADNLVAGGISVYPNPASDEIFVSGIDAGDVSLMELYDLAGSVVASVSEGNSMNVAEVNEGIYVLKVTSGENVIIEKIIIRH